MFPWLKLRNRNRPVAPATETTASPPIRTEPSEPAGTLQPEPPATEPTGLPPNPIQTPEAITAPQPTPEPASQPPAVQTQAEPQPETVQADTAAPLSHTQLFEAVIAAQRQKDYAAVLHQAEQLRAAAPKVPLGYLAAITALRALGRPKEAAAIATQGLQACPAAPKMLREGAECAEAAGDTELAYARYAKLRAVQPQSAAGYLGAIELSRRQAQPLQTRALLQAGLAALPEDRQLRLTAARHAAKREAWDEATQHWNILLAQDPDDAPLALEAAMSLIGRPPGRKGRLPGVFERLTAIHERFPDFVPAYTGHILALREAKQLDEAATRGQGWLRLFPNDRDLAMACARVAEVQGNHAEALSILSDIRARSNTTLALEIAYCRCLGLCGRHEEAELLSEATLARFPADDRAREQHAVVATRRGDFAEAARRSAQFLAEFPQSRAMRKLNQRMIGLGDDLERAVTAASPAASANTLTELFAGFESLGGNFGGCEFGMVQRLFHAESLGLLRWGNISLKGLTSGLQKRFEGLGDPDNIRLVIQRASANHSEYYLQDDQYQFWTHTGVKAEDAPADKVLKQSLRRTAFLRGKLLEDLESNSKIFVYKIQTDEPHEAILSLHAALTSYAPCTLLCVMAADLDHPHCTVEILQPGLLVGRNEAFMNEGNGGINSDAWTALCRQAHRLRLQPGETAEAVAAD